MNYEQNTIDWQVGDLVIHDADAKREDMLMRIVGKAGDDYLSVYSHGQSASFGQIKRGKEGFLKFKTKVFANPKSYLHDPAKFGIKTAASKIAELKAELEGKTQQIDHLLEINQQLQRTRIQAIMNMWEGDIHDTSHMPEKPDASRIAELKAELEGKTHQLEVINRTHLKLLADHVDLKAKFAKLKDAKTTIGEARKILFDNDFAPLDVPCAATIPGLTDPDRIKRFAKGGPVSPEKCHVIDRPLGVSQDEADKLKRTVDAQTLEISALKDTIERLSQRRAGVDKLLDHLVMCCTGKNSRGFQLRIDYCSIGKEWRMQVAEWKWLGYGRNREACATELRDKTMGANL